MILSQTFVHTKQSVKKGGKLYLMKLKKLQRIVALEIKKCTNLLIDFTDSSGQSVEL
jgi:hypothetical protein